VGLNAVARAAAAPAAAVSEAAAAEDALLSEGGFSRGIQYQFKSWVMSPLTQQEVEFTVKDGSL
jgi:hypothetical protein